ncbi:glycoside hydrolase family 88 protein [Termitidicoccus mucosus]|uniref:glycoside hydrolase family 88 protein n=1 Tax=Termitidicoccus mucosus TaxID=1184151 RepID=UPI000A04768E
MKRIYKTLFISTTLFAITGTVSAQEPLALARKVSDKVLACGSFAFEYTVQQPYSDAESVDFGRSCTPVTGVAYAVSTLQSDVSQEQTFEFGCRWPVKIWIDEKLVFERHTKTDFSITYDEKSYLLPEQFTVRLAKGTHKILIKSARDKMDATEDWLFVTQSINMTRYSKRGKRIRFSLNEYAPKAAQLAHWLVLGTFAGNINTVLPPETALEFHKVYNGAMERIAWNIPRVNLLTSNKDGGKFYAWNYHVGCFNWALQCLGAATGDARYSDYAARWCEYALDTFPMVEHQMRDLLAFRSMNFGQVGLPMLDYMSAPAMPFVTRLAAGKNFPGMERYRERAALIVDYLRNKQFRVDGIFARSYTEYPSIWADDMYMGIPYLVYWSKYTNDAAERIALLDDASLQIIKFNSYLYEPQVGLYRQACYPSKREEKVPFWSRGNGWALWSAVEVLDALPETHENRAVLMKIYRDHVDGLLRQQDSEGFWRNVLDMPASVRESSGAAIFTLCIACGINNGWLSREKYGPALERAWRALATFVDDNGDFNGVKGGTNFSTKAADYERISFIKSDTHGLLPFIFACIEMDKYFRRWTSFSS